GRLWQRLYTARLAHNRTCGVEVPIPSVTSAHQQKGTDKHDDAGQSGTRHHAPPSSPGPDAAPHGCDRVRFQLELPAGERTTQRLAHLLIKGVTGHHAS